MSTLKNLSKEGPSKPLPRFWSQMLFELFQVGIGRIARWPNLLPNHMYLILLECGDNFPIEAEFRYCIGWPQGVFSRSLFFYQRSFLKKLRVLLRYQTKFFVFAFCWKKERHLVSITIYHLYTSVPCHSADARVEMEEEKESGLNQESKKQYGLWCGFLCAF